MRACTRVRRRVGRSAGADPALDEAAAAGHHPAKPMTSPDRPTATAVETPLLVPPGAIVPGRARGLPLRREGPDKLTGAALYTDDLVTPGAWFGATIRSTVAHARL